MTPSDDSEQTITDDQPQSGDDDALFLRLKRWYKESVEHLAGWKTDAREDFAFVAGAQWTEEDKSALREQMRPVITFNRVGPVIDSVAGMEVGNRQEVTYLPREVTPQDAGVSEMLTNAAKFFRDESEAEDEESDAFYDAIVCGLGCTETRPDFEQDTDGLIPTDRIDPIATFYDPNSRKRNLTDRRYCGYVKEMSFEDAKALYPDADEDDLNAQWATAGLEDTSPHDATPQRAYNQGDQSDRTKERKTASIVYFEWWDREPVYVLRDPLSGQKTELSDKQMRALKKRFAQIAKTVGIEVPDLTKMAVKLTRKVFKNAFVGAKVLETGPGRCPDEFTINFITGKRDRNENVWYGLVRNMKDPQRWANKFFSTILHRINTTGKGLIVEETAVKNVRKFEENWARADAVKWVKDGAIGKEQIKELTGGAVAAAETQMMEFAISSIRDVTGVNLELLGAAENDQAGVVEYHRKQAGMTILAGLFDSLRRYRKQQGRALLYIIQEYIPEGRLIRIDSINGPQYVKLAKSPDTTKYDVIVDESPTSPNQKEAAWVMISQMIPLLSKLPVPPGIWSKLVQYSPLPQSLSDDISSMIEKQAQQPPAPDPKILALQQEAQIKSQQAQQAMQLEQQRADAQAQNDQREAEAQRQNDMRDAQLEANDRHQELLANIMEQKVKGAVDIMIARQKAAVDIEIARDKAKVDAETARTIASARAKQMSKSPAKER